MVSPAFLAIGHRGARGLYPENTLPAFAEALRWGVNELELDVVISADGEVVVSHEAWMNPTVCLSPAGERLPLHSREQYNLYKMPYKEIRRFDCGSLPHPDFPKQRRLPAFKPLLSELFAFTSAYTQQHQLPPARFLIEIKCGEDPDGHFNPAPEEMTERVCRVVESAQVSAACRLQSFDHRVLQAVRQRAPGLPLALLVEDTQPADAHLLRLGFVPDAYSPDFRLITTHLLQLCRKNGMRLIPWTVNNTRTMRRLIRLGVDGLITDYPDRLMPLIP